MRENPNEDEETEEGRDEEEEEISRRKGSYYPGDQCEAERQSARTKGPFKEAGVKNSGVRCSRVQNSDRHSEDDHNRCNPMGNCNLDLHQLSAIWFLSPRVQHFTPV